MEGTTIHVPNTNYQDQGFQLMGNDVTREAGGQRRVLEDGKQDEDKINAQPVASGGCSQSRTWSALQFSTAASLRMQVMANSHLERPTSWGNFESKCVCERNIYKERIRLIIK